MFNEMFKFLPFLTLGLSFAEGDADAGDKGKKDAGGADADKDKASDKDKDVDKDKDGSGDADKDKEAPEQKALRLEKELEKATKGIDSMQKRIDQLTAKKYVDKDKSSKEKTWDDLSVEELKEYRRRARAGGDDELVDFVNDKIAEKTADTRIKSEADRREANYIRINTWKEVCSEFPDLKDQTSDHYQETVKYIQEHQRLDHLLDYPDGHAEAARIVADKIQLRKLQNVDKEKKVAEDKLGKEKIKKDLGKSERKGAEGEDESLTKLRKTAEESGNPYSREWRAYLKALEDKQNLKEK